MNIELHIQNRVYYRAGDVAKEIQLDPHDEAAYGFTSENAILLRLAGIRIPDGSITIPASYNELVYLRDVLNRIIK